MNSPHTFCSCCGTRYPSSDWPRVCSNCNFMQFNNPTPIGVLLQTVTDGNRTGILTPIRGHAPMIGFPAETGGFQEVTDFSFEHTGCREFCEEIRLGQINPDKCELLMSRLSGPLLPVGKRQSLVFSVNPVPLHIDAFDDFIPDAETSAIDFAWGPKALAFPTHTMALALYFKKYQGMSVPAHYLHQPSISDYVTDENDSYVIYDIPYDQPYLDEGKWTVLIGDHIYKQSVQVVPNDSDIICKWKIA